MRNDGVTLILIRRSLTRPDSEVIVLPISVALPDHATVVFVSSGTSHRRFATRLGYIIRVVAITEPCKHAIRSCSTSIRYRNGRQVVNFFRVGVYLSSSHCGCINTALDSFDFATALRGSRCLRKIQRCCTTQCLWGDDIHRSHGLPFIPWLIILAHYEARLEREVGICR